MCLVGLCTITTHLYEIIFNHFQSGFYLHIKYLFFKGAPCPSGWKINFSEDQKKLKACQCGTSNRVYTIPTTWMYDQISVYMA